MAAAAPAADADGFASRLRGWRRLIGIAALLLPCVPLHYIWTLFGRASPWPRMFLRAVGWVAGVDVKTIGRPLARDVLIVVNHVTCLDIPILAGATGCRFVSKSEVRDWPLVGWLAGLNRTVYVERAERGRVQTQMLAVSTAIAEGQPVALFPEGTTGDGRTMLPFRASLLAALVPPPAPGVMMQPVMIDFGTEAPQVAWCTDTSIGAEAWRLLRMPGRRRVTIRCLDPIDPAALPDRKALAAAARGAMEAALQGAAA